MIVNPGIHVSTANAFTGIIPAVPTKSVKDIIQQPIETWKNELINDFEKIIFNDYPEIKTIKEELYIQGAIYASLSGSGSTVLRYFQKRRYPQFSFPQIIL